MIIFGYLSYWRGRVVFLILLWLLRSFFRLVLLSLNLGLFLLLQLFLFCSQFKLKFFHLSLFLSLNFSFFLLKLFLLILFFLLLVFLLLKQRLLLLLLLLRHPILQLFLQQFNMFCLFELNFSFFFFLLCQLLHLLLSRQGLLLHLSCVSFDSGNLSLDAFIFTAVWFSVWDSSCWWCRWCLN